MNVKIRFEEKPSRLWDEPRYLAEFFIWSLTKWHNKWHRTSGSNMNITHVTSGISWSFALFLLRQCVVANSARKCLYQVWVYGQLKLNTQKCSIPVESHCMISGKNLFWWTNLRNDMSSFHSGTVCVCLNYLKIWCYIGDTIYLRTEYFACASKNKPIRRIIKLVFWYLFLAGKQEPT